MSVPQATIVRPLEVAIYRSEVQHFLEYPPEHEPSRRIQQLLDELLPQARTLCEARGCYVHLPVNRASELGLEPIDADGLVIGLVTVGAGIEARAAELSSSHQVTRALVLDAAGSAAAEEAADRLGALIAREAQPPSSHHFALSTAAADAPRIPAIPCRLSPGYGRWDVTAQRALFPLLPHDRVGVALLPSCLMVPRKSISFAMWLGARGRIGRGLAGCSRCTLESCRYRREASVQTRPVSPPFPIESNEAQP